MDFRLLVGALVTVSIGRKRSNGKIDILYWLWTINVISDLYVNKCLQITMVTVHVTGHVNGVREKLPHASMKGFFGL